MAVSRSTTSPETAPRDVKVDRNTRVAAATAVPATVVGTAETPEAAQAPREQRLQVFDGSLPRESTVVKKQGVTGQVVDREEFGKTWGT